MIAIDKGNKIPIGNGNSINKNADFVEFHFSIFSMRKSSQKQVSMILRSVVKDENGYEKCWGNRIKTIHNQIFGEQLRNCTFFHNYWKTKTSQNWLFFLVNFSMMWIENNVSFIPKFIKSNSTRVIQAFPSKITQGCEIRWNFSKIKGLFMNWLLFNSTNLFPWYTYLK